MTGKLVGVFSYELQATSYKCGWVGAKNLSPEICDKNKENSNVVLNKFRA